MVTVAIVGAGPAGRVAAWALRRHPQVQTLHIEAEEVRSASLSLPKGELPAAPELATRYYRGHPQLIHLFARQGAKEVREAWAAVNGAGREAGHGSQADFLIQDTAMGEWQASATHCRSEPFIRNKLTDLVHEPPGRFRLWLAEGQPLVVDRLILATGCRGRGLNLAQALGHRVHPPVPTLFSFLIRDRSLNRLSGLEMPAASARLPAQGDLPLTEARGGVHVLSNGLGGPAILDLSGQAATWLHQRTAGWAVEVDWLGPVVGGGATRDMQQRRAAFTRRLVAEDPLWDLDPRLWAIAVAGSRLAPDTRWGGLDARGMQRLLSRLRAMRLAVHGRRMDPEEGSCCGGIDLDDLDMRSLESRSCPGLHFAGSILHADGPPGGYNLYLAVASGLQAAQAIAEAKP